MQVERDGRSSLEASPTAATLEARFLKSHEVVDRDDLFFGGTELAVEARRSRGCPMDEVMRDDVWLPQDDVLSGEPPGWPADVIDERRKVSK
mmetsp:Transcript_26743/g.56669  ORF Transcript_26743/g.56669 Transcript_26743/m.56669 type:complete len:92 (+) Transcript_26743:637-912(+)